VLKAHVDALLAVNGAGVCGGLLMVVDGTGVCMWLLMVVVVHWNRFRISFLNSPLASSLMSLLFNAVTCQYLCNQIVTKT
jgi:ABC-type uncharacterized transport system permease subunit